MWTLYDMASGEIIEISAEPRQPASRPLPLYAPGAGPSLCPLTVASAPSSRRLPREVVLAGATGQPWRDD
jgi:hypothetical protein